MYKINTSMIKDYMNEHNLTAKEFSKICNLSYSTMLKFIKGYSGFRFQTYVKVSRAMNIRISKIIRYVKNKKSK